MLRAFAIRAARHAGRLPAPGMENRKKAMQRRLVLGAAPALLVAASLGLSGCSQPLYDTGGGTFTGQAPLDARARQIERAGAGLGWRFDPVRPGLMRATLNIRSHVAVTEIGYDETRFTIRYVDSRNLSYSGTSIHKNYNGWIRNLERAISQQPVP